MIYNHLLYVPLYFDSLPFYNYEHKTEQSCRIYK